MTQRRDIALTFAGGGNRAFYQVGLMEEWGESLWPRVGAVAACSAGSAAATLILSGRLDEAREHFASQRVGVRGLFSVERLRRGERPFPHDEIYRATLEFAFAGGGFERIREAPFPIRILCAAFPRRIPRALGIAVGVALYQAEKYADPGLLHPRLPRKLGFEERWWDARDCESVTDLVELILSSSSTPPFTDIGSFDGPLIDGSMVDNAPAHLAEGVPGVDKSIVLLTRPYDSAHVGHRGKRYYVAPQEKLPVEKWDYREHAPVDETFDVGRREASHHRSGIDAFLAT